MNTYRGAFDQKNPLPKSKFAAFRYSLQMTQTQMAKVCGVGLNDIARYEKDRYPSIPVLLRMMKSAKEHGVNLTLDIFDDEEMRDGFKLH